MKGIETNFLKFLQQPNQCVIPINQDTDSWVYQQFLSSLEQLDDVMALVHQAFDKHSE